MHSQHDMNELVSRINKLDQKLKSQRKILTVTYCLSILFLCIFIAQYMGVDLFRPKVVRAEKFILQDESGAVRSELSTRNDMTLFAMFDRHGVPRNALFSEPQSNGFHVYDEKGIRRSVLGYRDHETSLVFLNSGGLYQSGLVARNDGVFAFQVGDKEQIPLHLLNDVKVNGSAKSG